MKNADRIFTTKNRRKAVKIGLGKRAKAWCASMAGVVLTSSVWAADRLAEAINGDVQDMLGSGSSLWKIFI